MAVAMSNNACSQLEGAIDDTVTSLVIGPEGIFFPPLVAGDWFYGTLSNDPINAGQLPEIVKVTVISIDGGTGDYNLTVERGAGRDGALPKSWSDQSLFQLLVTSELLYDLVLEGVTVAGATSFILKSKTIINDYPTTVDDNGCFLNASPSVDDLIISLHEIPATASEDIRIVINKRSNTSDGTVVVNAFPGQTINGLVSVSIDQQYSALILHSRAGEINWDLISIPNYTTIPNDGNVYGITYGPNWVLVVEEAPADGNHYVRQDDEWVLGVGEAPDDGTTYVRNGATKSWVPETTAAAAAGSPVGIMAPYAGITPPEGWFLCAGQSFSRTGYPLLFASIGTTYGSADATSFFLPDLRGRTIRGLDNMGGTEAGVYPGRNTLGSVYGSATWTMTSAQLPVHNHTVASVGGGTHTHNLVPNNHAHTVNGGAGQSIYVGTGPGGPAAIVNSGFSSYVSQSISSTNTAHSHSITLNNAGSSSSISSATPFMDMHWIIKHD